MSPKFEFVSTCVRMSSQDTRQILLWIEFINSSQSDLLNHESHRLGNWIWGKPFEELNPGSHLKISISQSTVGAHLCFSSFATSLFLHWLVYSRLMWCSNPSVLVIIFFHTLHLYTLVSLGNINLSWQYASRQYIQIQKNQEKRAEFEKVSSQTHYIDFALGNSNSSGLWSMF